MILTNMNKKDTTDLCFICDKKLVGNGVQFDSSRTYIGNELLTEKIAGILGKHFVVIVNNKDRLCYECVAQLNDIDMMEMDLKVVKNALLSSIKNKYGLSMDSDDEIEPIMVEDGVLKADRSKVSNPLGLEQINKPSEILNIQHQKVPTPSKGLMPRQVLWPQNPQPPGKRLKVMMPQQVPKEIQSHNSEPKQQKFQNDMPTHPNKITAKHNTQNTSRAFPKTKEVNPAPSSTVKSLQPKIQLNN